MFAYRQELDTFTGRQIDALVYELYGLTEEIGVVEATDASG